MGCFLLGFVALVLGMGIGVGVLSLLFKLVEWLSQYQIMKMIGTGIGYILFALVGALGITAIGFASHDIGCSIRGHHTTAQHTTMSMNQ